MKLLMLVLLPPLFVVACAGSVVDVVDRLGPEMERSKAAYKRCLDQQPSGAEACQKEQRQFEADLAAYAAALQGFR